MCYINVKRTQYFFFVFQTKKAERIREMREQIVICSNLMCTSANGNEQNLEYFDWQAINVVVCGVTMSSLVEPSIYIYYENWRIGHISVQTTRKVKINCDVAKSFVARKAKAQQTANEKKND